MLIAAIDTLRRRLLAAPIYRRSKPLEPLLTWKLKRKPVNRCRIRCGTTCRLSSGAVAAVDGDAHSKIDECMGRWHAIDQQVHSATLRLWKDKRS